ncbi:hypothetical protein IJJ08_03240 [bacterium]|nr:hypothetical protein [bacterium]
MFALINLVKSLLLTIVFEAGTSWLLDKHTWREQLVVLVGNLLTNPLFVVVMSLVSRRGLEWWLAMLLATQTAIILLEAWFFRWSICDDFHQALELSTFNNLVSVVGILCLSSLRF